METGDDAAVYRLRPDLGLGVATDFFTPVVDDAYTFGAIAAANALSDVYAMGGVPLLAINLVAFPIKELPASILADILRGGSDKVQEAGIDILGGHSIDDHEPKYGLAVTGTVHPDRIVRNRGGRPGDSLVLTKPLGTGVITTAINAPGGVRPGAGSGHLSDAAPESGRRRRHAGGRGRCRDRRHLGSACWAISITWPSPPAWRP